MTKPKAENVSLVQSKFVLSRTEFSIFKVLSLQVVQYTSVVEVELFHYGNKYDFSNSNQIIKRKLI